MNTLHPWFWQNLSETMETFEQVIENTDDPKAVVSVMDEAADYLGNQFIDNYHSALRTEQFYQEGFEHRLQAKWRHALGFLEFFIILNHALGRSRNYHYRDTAAANDDYVFDALTRLHARGCKISREILTLLKSGYTEGADARWRTLHELAATAFFIKETGQKTAERFLLYKTIEDYYEIQAFQEHQEALGYDPLPEDEVNAVEEARELLIDRFGEEYDRMYGWAFHEFSKGRLSFTDIEKATEMDHYRHFYKMASDNVHAGSKGLLYHSGIAGDATVSQQILPAGPSNYGLEGPGQFTAISMSQLTAAVLTHDPDPFWVLCGSITNTLCDSVIEAFVTAKIELDRDIANTY